MQTDVNNMNIEHITTHISYYLVHTWFECVLQKQFVSNKWLIVNSRNNNNDEMMNDSRKTRINSITYE